MNKATFRHWILALAERHGRELTPGTVLLYKAALGGMDEADFEAACSALFIAGDRFPSPQDILDASPQRARREALQHRLFEQLYTRVTGYWEPSTTNEQKAHRIDDLFGQQALAAFQATGGFERWLAVFRGQDERQVEWLRKDFLYAHRTIQLGDAGRELAASPTTRRLVAASQQQLDKANTNPALHRVEQALLGSGA